MKLPSPSVALARALAWLALAGASLGLMTQQLGTPRFWVEVWRANALPLPVRRALILWMALGALAAWVGAAVYAWRRGAGAQAGLERAGRLAGPLVLAALWPGVCSVDAWSDPLQASIVITAFVLALEPLVRRALAAVPASARDTLTTALTRLPVGLRRWTAPALVALGTIGYALYMSHYTVLNHQRFNTSSYDLGIYDNQFWHALHGHPFHASPVLRHEPDWSVLKTHAEWSMYVLLPFYALRPGPETLLVLQSCLLAAGAIPIYRFATRRLGRTVGCVLAFAYLLYPPLHGANFYDFHFQPLGAVLVLFCIDLLDGHHLVAFAIFFALALSTREDISVMLLFWGAWLVASGERPRAGLTVAALSAIYFVLMKFVIMPHFGRWWFADMYRELFPPDDHSFGGILQTLVCNPVYVMRTLMTGDKLRYTLQITGPLAFLPLRFPRLWWFLVPGIFFTLLSTQYAPTIDIAFQYSAYWFPMLFPAAALALALYGSDETGRLRRSAAVVTLLFATLLMTRHFGAIPPRQSFRAGFGLVHFGPLSEWDKRKARDLDDLAAMVPFDARLAVSEQELPHIARRPDVYSLKDGMQDADWILYAPGTLGSRAAEEAQRAGVMQRVATRPGLILLHRR